MPYPFPPKLFLRPALTHSDHEFPIAALQSSIRHLRDGTGDPMEQSDVLRLVGTLRMDQGRYPEAIVALVEVATIARRVGDRTQESKAMYMIARALHGDGMPDAALAFFDRAAAMLDTDPQGDFSLWVEHARSSCLVDVGRHWDAARAFKGCRHGLERSFPFPAKLRVPWLAARIDLGLGLRERSQEVLESVQDGFRQSGHDHDVALVAVDLCKAYLAGGRRAQAETLAQETLPFFADREMYHKASQLKDLAQQARR